MLNSMRHQLLRLFGWSRVAVIYEEHPGNLYYAVGSYPRARVYVCVCFREYWPFLR